MRKRNYEVKRILLLSFLSRDVIAAKSNFDFRGVEACPLSTMRAILMRVRAPFHFCHGTNFIADS